MRMTLPIMLFGCGLSYAHNQKKTKIVAISRRPASPAVCCEASRYFRRCQERTVAQTENLSLQTSVPQEDIFIQVQVLEKLENTQKKLGFFF